MMFIVFGTPGIGEMVLIVAIILILFGGKQVPEIAKSLGKAIREFKRIANDIKAPDSNDDDTTRS